MKQLVLPDIRTLKYLVCGVTLLKMRKMLVVRNPYAIMNNTPYEYVLKILDEKSLELKTQFILKPQSYFPIDFEYYQGHSL